MKFLTNNLSYKLVALVVTLILWLTMLSRKDSVMVREVNIKYLTSANHVLINAPRLTARIRVSGPRVALKKFSQADNTVIVDLTRFRPGRQVIRLTQDALTLPIGVRVLSIEPQEVDALIKDNNGGRDEQEGSRSRGD